jgi:hypothetical protein
MSNTSNFYDNMKPVFMSWDDAESIIYSEEFFNVKRFYNCARKYGDIVIKEAEQNLRQSTKLNFDLKQSLDLEDSGHEDELEDLFEDIDSKGKKHIASSSSRKGSLESILDPKACFRIPSEYRRSLPASPTLHIRSMSLTPEPIRQNNIDRQHDTIQANTRNNDIDRKNYPTCLPVKSNSLFRTNNVGLTNRKKTWCNSNPNILQSTNQIQLSETSRLHQIRPQNSFLLHSKDMTFGNASSSATYHGHPATTCSQTASFNGISNNSKRLTNQLTLPESWSGASRNIEEESLKNASSVGRFGNIRKNMAMEYETTLGIKNERPVNYYIVGTTHNT